MSEPATISTRRHQIRRAGGLGFAAPVVFHARMHPTLLGSLLAGALFFSAAAHADSPTPADTAGGWVKYEKNPILGGQYGTCFDISVLHDYNDGKGSIWSGPSIYRMWVSWRPQKSIALVESADGFQFAGPPKVVLGPELSGWEDAVNRPVVLRRPDGYHMWYTGQTATGSAIGYATSLDGVAWKRMNTPVLDPNLPTQSNSLERMSARPVLKPNQPWEKVAVMCPDVMWDEDAKLYRMWYSGGEQYEPNALGYATSPDGITWTKYASNPVFTGDPKIDWEKQRATACHVVKTGGWFYMFYIGFRDVDHAQIGVARSRDGITHWQRLPANPIVRSGTGKWDDDACYKPYAILKDDRWLLWYNGRKGSLEQIGLVTHTGADLGFPPAP
jgi:predicted GH43/DUF377 family glycosyl hydrolase